MGIDELEDCLKEMFYDNKLDFNDEVIITSLRHKENIKEAIESLKLVKDSIDDGYEEDLYIVDMMGAYQSLGNIIGESVEEDLIDTIFREFCMGK